MRQVKHSYGFEKAALYVVGLLTLIILATQTPNAQPQPADISPAPLTQIEGARP